MTPCPRPCCAAPRADIQVQPRAVKDFSGDLWQATLVWMTGSLRLCNTLCLRSTCLYIVWVILKELCNFKKMGVLFESPFGRYFLITKYLNTKNSVSEGEPSLLTVISSKLHSCFLIYMDWIVCFNAEKETLINMYCEYAGFRTIRTWIQVLVLHNTYMTLGRK